MFIAPLCGALFVDNLPIDPQDFAHTIHALAQAVYWTVFRFGVFCVSPFFKAPTLNKMNLPEVKAMLSSFFTYICIGPA
jgi:hypothetical protein